VSTVINLADARARGIDLPPDDAVAQDILDSVEARATRKLGALTGSRTERFYVGRNPYGKLSLSRYTASVTITDNSVAVDADDYRLIDNGSGIYRTATIRNWTGPYVDVTYTPADEDELRQVLYDLVALRAQPASRYNSERIGDYSYSRNRDTTAAQEAALLSSLLPKRDPLTSAYIAPRRLVSDSPIINLPEVWP
jgi:hypothetical protein